MDSKEKLVDTGVVYPCSFMSYGLAHLGPFTRSKTNLQFSPKHKLYLLQTTHNKNCSTSNTGGGSTLPSRLVEWQPLKATAIFRLYQSLLNNEAASISRNMAILEAN